MSILSKLFHGKSVDVEAVEPRPNDTVLENIEVLMSDKEVVMALAGDLIYEWSRGTDQGNYIFDYLKLCGEDAAEVAEAARKIRALHDLRAIRNTLYYGTLSDVTVLDGDRYIIASLAGHEYKDNGSEVDGTYNYEAIIVSARSEAEVALRVRKIESLCLRRAADDHVRALATIAELSL